MKRIYLLALALCAALSVPAQSSLDLQSRAQLRQHRLERKQAPARYAARVNKLKKQIGVPATHVLGMIKLAPGATVDELEAGGVNVLRSRYGFAFVSVPVDDVERVAALKCVRRLQLARAVSPKMDKARAAGGVEKIHQGIDLPRPYTGKGVVCGIVDGGIDPNHINFRDAAGNSRIGMLAHITVNQNTGTDLIERFYGRDEIRKFQTDDNTSYHGTHTLGIMAGGYMGNSTVAGLSADGMSATLSEQPNPFYGVAYEADIAAACGDLLDMIIAFGVDYIIQYAEEEKKPSVINLSLGSNSGAHDGKSVLSQFFDACVEEANAIICVAAGNEGDKQIALNKTFTGTDTELKTFVAGDYYPIEGESLYARAGNVMIYSEDDTPFDLQAVVFNKKRGTIAGRFAMTVSEANQGTGRYWVSSSDFQDSSDDVITSQFGNYFEGYVALGWDIDPDNNRFYAIVDYYAINNMLRNAEENYQLGFIVTGKEGQRIDCFCDGLTSWLSNSGVEGWDDGMRDGSISDMATCENTLVVGSYDTRDSWGALDGAVHSSSYALSAGEITSFSSYGTLVDGRSLPHVCAPGAAIVSSMNNYYVDGFSISNETLNACLETGGHADYWGWSLGTSMATPYVAGAIALWLEADPTLTIDDIKDIIARTAVKDEAVLRANPVQAGAGKFDAYAGLKEVIRRNPVGINGPRAADKRLLVTPAGNRTFRVFLGGAAPVEAVVYDLAGKAVLRGSAAGDEVLVDASALGRGVYVLCVNGTCSQRIIVK